MKLEIEIPEQENKAGGWTVNFDFVSKVRDKSGGIYSVGMEETEAVILALLDIANETKNT